MRSSRSTCRSIWFFAPAIILTAMLVTGTRSFAQFGQNWFDHPEIRKFWNPVVGKGSVYETTRGGKKSTMEFEVLSKETVDGQAGYWFEIASDDSSSGGKFFAKMLMVPGATGSRRIIFKLPNMDAMEMPMNGNPYGGRGNNTKPDSDSKAPPKLLGTETITVPAGTFTCEHYQESDGDEAWINSKVSPITVVKRVTKSETMILVKQIDAVEHITGPVKPFDPMAMRGMMQQQH